MTHYIFVIIFPHFYSAIYSMYRECVLSIKVAKVEVHT